MTKLEVINTSKTELYGMMHSAAQPWAIIRSNTEGLIIRCVGRYASRSAAVRRMYQLDRKPSEG